ncbi:DUF4952 domain-containing protein [Pseudomonas sp. B2M1-30]|uniref:DUF4952 domain-containing protein n=1 Tax=Pseudomonas koreensis TaxID=198620 RepID=A0A9X2XI17_9PSED|nr:MULTISPECIES: DUF4952 domain-containing protein [Pseudomonas]MBV4474045.1 DUF4952 domain-containing protein [Pseudomonas botevensis]MCU0121118.1 DUF4952 domain-containing protein [Pseudomonas sp. B2M1-30]MCU7249216.1 DUF4952 domain-containing protein [Pseudomonas koreensis]MCU7262747.1 DUF4952 domain-containing protein [Pseudomonas koreensis]
MKRLIHGLLLLSLSLLSMGARAEFVCEDFLAKIGAKPEFVKFVQCSQDTERQGKPLVALYHVPGPDAANAEHYLNQRFGLPPLKRYCCIWESSSFFYRDRKTGVGYELAMASEETLVHERESWPAIGSFYINVLVYTEEP